MGEGWTLFVRALSLDDTLWRDLVTNPQGVGVRLALWLVFLAGLAEALAQSLVLFANEVKPRRFALSLFVNALLFVGGFIVQALSIDLVADLIYGKTVPLETNLKAVALAYAPLILSFVIMVPYFGRGLGIFLNVYSLLVLSVAVAVTYGLFLEQAIVCLALGWLTIVLVRGSVGRPIIWLNRALRNRVAGRQLEPLNTVMPHYRPPEDRRK